jgi:hypothetical protein
MRIPGEIKDLMPDQYKLIHFYYDIDTWELYDLYSDPREMNNVYNNPDYEEINSDPREMNNVYNNPDYEEIKKKLKEQLKELQSLILINFRH